MVFEGFGVAAAVVAAVVAAVALAAAALAVVAEPLALLVHASLRLVVVDYSVVEVAGLVEHAVAGRAVAGYAVAVVVDEEAKDHRLAHQS